MPFQPLDSPAAWTVADLQASSDWRYSLTEADVAELEAAVQHALATGKEIHVRQGGGWWVWGGVGSVGGVGCGEAGTGWGAFTKDMFFKCGV